MNNMKRGPETAQRQRVGVKREGGTQLRGLFSVAWGCMNGGRLAEYITIARIVLGGGNFHLVFAS